MLLHKASKGLGKFSSSGDTRWEKPQRQLEGSSTEQRVKGQQVGREKSLSRFIFVCILIVGLLTSGMVYVLPWKQQPWSPAQLTAICKGIIVGLFV